MFHHSDLGKNMALFLTVTPHDAPLIRKKFLRFENIIFAFANNELFSPQPSFFRASLFGSLISIERR